MKQKVKKPLGIGKAVAAVAITTIAAGTFLLSRQYAKTPLYVPAYEVLRVIDGEQFESKEKLLFRLMGIGSPKASECGATQAKKELEKRILSKDVYIKIVDNSSTPFNSLAYVDGKQINEEMLKTGWVRLNKNDIIKDEKLLKAAKEAEVKKRGVFSSICKND